MLVLGHTGITLGIGWLLESAWRRKSSNPAREESIAGQNPDFTHGISSVRLLPRGRANLATLGGWIDYRLLLLGSMLPDIIDKPIGQVFFRNTFSNGRIFAHTLLFLIVITLLGLYLYRSRGKLWLLILSLGCAIHLILDQMWLVPRTLIWPIYGWGFEKLDLSNWWANIWHAVLTDPYVYVPEIIGAIILVGSMLTLVRRKRVYTVIKNGQV